MRAWLLQDAHRRQTQLIVQLNWNVLVSSVEQKFVVIATTITATSSARWRRRVCTVRHQARYCCFIDSQTCVNTTAWLFLLWDEQNSTLIPPRSRRRSRGTPWIGLHCCCAGVVQDITWCTGRKLPPNSSCPKKDIWERLFYCTIGHRFGISWRFYGRKCPFLRLSQNERRLRLLLLDISLKMKEADEFSSTRFL